MIKAGREGEASCYWNANERPKWSHPEQSTLINKTTQFKKPDQQTRAVDADDRIEKWRWGIGDKGGDSSPVHGSGHAPRPVFEATMPFAQQLWGQVEHVR